MTLSGGTLQLLRRATLSPNSAPSRWQCQKAPAPIEKARCTPARVTRPAEGRTSGRGSVAPSRAPRFCHSRPTQARARPDASLSGGGRNARNHPRPGHLRECRLLHPRRHAPRARAWNLQAGQVPVRPQGTRAQEKGISLSDLRPLLSASSCPAPGRGGVGGVGEWRTGVALPVNLPGRRGPQGIYAGGVNCELGRAEGSGLGQKRKPECGPRFPYML